MIVDQGTLKDAISRWLLRDNTDLVVTQDQIDNYIQMAEAEIRRELLIRDIQSFETISLDGSTNTAPLPDDYGALYDAYFETPNFTLEYYPTKKSLINKFFGCQPGRPQGYTIYGSEIIFGPSPDTAYDIIFDYYQRFPGIDDEDNTENVILTKYPDVYLYGALKQAQMQIQDAERLEAYGGNFSTIISRILIYDQQGRLAVGTRPRIKPIGGR